MKKAEELVETKITVDLKVLEIVDKYIGRLYADITKNNTLIGLGLGILTIGLLNKFEKQEDYGNE